MTDTSMLPAQAPLGRESLPPQCILGQPPSKSNAYRVVRIAGHGSLAKTPQLKRYEDAFFNQCSLRGLRLGTRFMLQVDVYFTSDRPDLDNSLKIILDCLQACSVIKNDRLCAEIHARKLIDRQTPRIEFRITKLL